MVPIDVIRRWARDCAVPDIERIAARLEHHGYRIAVRNSILSDTGDRWVCLLTRPQEEGADIQKLAPTLRGAVLGALKVARERE